MQKRDKAKKTPRASALFALAFMSSSCALFVSFSDYDTDLKKFGIKGTVDGLFGGVVAELTLNAHPPPTRVPNGPFTFAEKLSSGTTYVVQATARDHLCTVLHDQGTIASSDITDIAVHCLPSEAALTALTVSGPGGVSDFPLEPKFDAAYLGPYGAHLHAGVTPTFSAATITATTRSSAATLTIGGNAAVSAVPFSVPIVLGSKSVDIVVKTPAGVVARYDVLIGNHHSDWLLGIGRSGSSVALSGDTLAAGEPENPSGATGINGDEKNATAPKAGAVRIYRRIGGVWTQEAFVKPLVVHAGDNFGVAVALSGDVLVVGANSEASKGTGVNGGGEDDTSVVSSGAAYVFRRTNGIWAQEGYLKASRTRTASFGSAVGISGDVIVIGAPSEQGLATGINGNQDLLAPPGSLPPGAVYAFSRASGVWKQEAYIKASNARIVSSFGNSLAMEGNSLVVGAPRETGTATGIDGDQTASGSLQCGAAYSFVRSGGVWSQGSFFKASKVVSKLQFGQAVAISGEVIAVGARSDPSNGTSESDQSAPSAGAVHVFRKAGSTWTSNGFLKATTPRALASFGSAVAVLGDTLIAGAPGESSGATDLNGNQGDTSVPFRGAAYRFRYTGAWVQEAYIKSAVQGADVYFGSPLAIGPAGIAVGAPKESAVHFF